MTRNDTTMAIIDVIAIAASVAAVVLTMKACTDADVKTYDELKPKVNTRPAVNLDDIYPPMGTGK